MWLDPSTGEREGNGEKDGGSVLSNVGCGVYGWNEEGEAGGREDVDHVGFDPPSSVFVCGIAETSKSGAGG